MEGHVAPGASDSIAHQCFELGAGLFQKVPRVNSFELAQLSEPGNHGQRIPRQSAGLINRPFRRKLIHDFSPTTECPDWQPAANHFSQRSEIGFDTEELLSTATGDTKSCYHFVEDQERLVFGTFISQGFQKIFPGEIKTGVRRNWFDDHSGDLLFVFPKRFSDKVDIVKWQRNR